MTPELRAVFDAAPPAARERLIELRDLILATAAAEALAVAETLKWGEPAWHATDRRIGTTVRIGCKAARPGQCAVYFNCQTQLVDELRTRFPELTFEGARALWIDDTGPLPEAALRTSVTLALCWHRIRREAALGKG